MYIAASRFILHALSCDHRQCECATTRRTSAALRTEDEAIAYVREMRNNQARPHFEKERTRAVADSVTVQAAALHGCALNGYWCTSYVLHGATVNQRTHAHKLIILSRWSDLRVGSHTDLHACKPSERSLLQYVHVARCSKHANNAPLTNYAEEGSDFCERHVAQQTAQRHMMKQQRM
jgi:hypothetical protein